MRVVVWDMRKATNASPAWNYFLELAPDLALLQEVGSIPETVGRTYVSLEGQPARPGAFRSSALPFSPGAKSVPQSCSQASGLG